MSLKRDSSITFVRSICTIGIILVTQTVLARALGTVGRGQFAVCLTFINLMSIIFSFGINSSNAYMIASKRQTPEEALAISMVLGAFFALIAVALGYFISLFPIAFFEKAPHGYFLLALSVIPCTIFFWHVTSMLRGMKCYFSMNLVFLLNPLIVLFFIILFCLILDLHVRGAILAYFLGPVLGILISLLFLRKHLIGVRVLPKFYQIKESVSYGIRSVFSYLLSSLNIQMATLIIPFFAPVEQVGYFAIAMAIVSRLWIIPESIVIVLMPKIAEDRYGGAQSTTNAIRKVIILSGIAAFLILVLIKPFIIFFLGEEFMPVAMPVMILLPGVTILAIGKILSGYLLGIDKPGLNSIVRGISIGINIVLMILLIPIWSLVGASFATASAYVFESTVLIILFIRLNEASRVKDLIPTIKDFNQLYLTMMENLRRIKSPSVI